MKIFNETSRLMVPEDEMEAILSAVDTLADLSCKVYYGCPAYAENDQFADAVMGRSYRNPYVESGHIKELCFVAMPFSCALQGTLKNDQYAKLKAHGFSAIQFSEDYSQINAVFNGSFYKTYNETPVQRILWALDKAVRERGALSEPSEKEAVLSAIVIMQSFMAHLRTHLTPQINNNHHFGEISPL